MTEGPYVKSLDKNGPAPLVHPGQKSVDETIPERAREFLRQALDSPPSGAQMLAASAVDAMLKDKNFKGGTLYQRIATALDAHLITKDMADWAHEVRLDANDQRHADETAPLPNADDARRTTDFALALADYLYVLPARVKRGRAKEAVT